MHRAQRQVRDFVQLIQAGPTSPARPAIRDAELRARLIAEEAAETVAGLVGGTAARAILNEYAAAAATRGPPDLTEVVDGICDLIYVAYGAAEAVGVDLEPFFDDVHRANMTKLSAPKVGDVVAVHGKMGAKSPGWQPPRTRELLEAAVSATRNL